MNCALHPETAAVAYCRTCGKALCASCVRQVHGVVYCEDCLASRVEGQPAQPVPDLFGMGLGTSAEPLAVGAVVATGEPQPATNRFPTGAIILMGLGFLFLLSTLDLFSFDWFGHLWPLFLIGLGVHMFYR